MSTTGFKKADWIDNTNIYEVNLRQYSEAGTFNAFEKVLDRLRDMGVETLWFMPLTPISQKNKKGLMGSYYACSDYRSINPEFGTADDFKNLVIKAKGMGFKVILDWVANHTGWDHVWTRENSDYFLNDPLTHDFKMASGMDDIIELDYKNEGLRKAMIAAMVFWIKEFDIDGFRCDLAFWVELNFWKEARTELEKIKTLFWLGEFDALDNPEYFEAFDAAYTWSWMHKAEAFYKKNADFNLLQSLLFNYDIVCGKKNIALWFTSNHDENSWNGTEYEKYGELAMLLAVFSFTWNGIPLVYSGQELPNKKRMKFFEKDAIAWNGKYELHDFYKTLSHLKKRNAALAASSDHCENIELESNGGNKLVYLRKNGNNEVLVVLNFSNENIDVEITDSRLSGHFTDVFSNGVIEFNSKKCFGLKPWSWLVLEKRVA